MNGEFKLRISGFGRLFAIAAAVVLSLGVFTAAPASAAGPTINIVSEHNQKCLELLGFNNNNGAEVGTWDCWGGANQKWYWDGDQIRNVQNHKCLELLGFNNNNGAHVGLWDCWGGSNQKWYRNGAEIRNKQNNKCLEILGFNNNNNGAVSGLWDCWGGSNQRWYDRAA
ncbi:ricin-type beta-trefoil lectin domain protein [Lentzea tibetensis]|uniref:Ricin-type beta-trefoil lectin domain protein n=1 Tax=Lentzea tibetensis TaxID=2591470 RepID=A0A563EPD9_9PSEU|nr:ricin-type beta-trefoil lectin domain protein [Lentzea tibetensis]